MGIHRYICVHIIYIYIHKYGGRGRERERERFVGVCVYTYDIHRYKCVHKNCSDIEIRFP